MPSLQSVKQCFILLAFVLPGVCFSQEPATKSTYNEAYWTAYADKIHLEGKKREEFLNSHKKAGTPAPVSYSIANPINPAARAIPDITTAIMAGPCINADFESGNLTGWTRTSGFHPGYNPLGCCPNGGGQQAIMSNGNDPYGGFPRVFPGGNFSLRLGDNVNGGQADRIEQTFLVSPANANFSYKYAVVLEEPGHSQNQQPSFQVEMLDSTGAQIPCTFYNVAAGQGIPGFFNSPSPGVIYKPWTTVLVDLTPYMNQNVTIVFTTYDCSLGGHFGYAYIDGVCQAFTGGGSSTVCAGSTQTFCAPAGLASYTWNGPGVVNAVGQCVNALLPGVYTVQTTLFTNCNGPSFTYTLNTQPQPIASAGPGPTVCANNSTVSLLGNITGFPATPQWTSGGSGVFSAPTSFTTNYIPSPADIIAGFVNITLTSTNNGVCPPSTSTAQIIITPAPNVNAGTSQTVCSNVQPTLSGTVSGVTNTGIWGTSGTGFFTPSNTLLTTSYQPSPGDILAGSVVFSLTSTGNGLCNPVTKTVSITFAPLPTVTASAPLNPVCSNASTIALTGTVVGITPTGSWTTNGAGSFIPGAGTVNTTYSLSPTDVGLGAVVFSLTSTNNGVCSAVTTTISVSITPLSTVNAGPSQTVCSSTPTVQLNGSVNPGTPLWTASGGGLFLPNNAIVNPVYSITPANLAAGSVTFTIFSINNGPCPVVQNTMVVAIKNLPAVNAGPSQSVCATVSSVSLSGTINGATSTGSWTTNGNGLFTPTPNSVNTTYNINPADIPGGSIVFTLTSTNNGPCPAVSNTLSLSFFTLAVVNAGPNQLICSNAGTIGLNGSSTNQGSWATSGAGTFSPSNSFLNATYSVTPADITTGFVTFTFSSANNGACPVVTDSVKIGIRTIASVVAGPSQSICSVQSSVPLNGNVSGGTNTGIWTSSGAGNFNPGPAVLNGSYVVNNPTDISTGYVQFTLTSTNNGPCPAVTDTLQLTIFRIATVTANPNQALCSNAGTLALTGVINSLSNTAVWSVNGTGTFGPDNSSLNPIYTMSAFDINLGALTFSLTSTNNGPCPAVKDTVKVTIKKIAEVYAGPDKVICSTSPVVGLVASVANAPAVWSHNGAGSIVPSNTNMAITYSVAHADITKGIVKLALASLDNGVCPQVIDSVNIIIRKNTVLRLSQDTNICSYNNPLVISPNITGDVGDLKWTTTGLGTFMGNDNTSPVTYNIANDIPKGFVVLNLAITNNGPCANAAGTISISIRPAPIAGFSQSTGTANIPYDPVKFTNMSQKATSYYWTFGDGGSSSAVNPIHNYREVGFYKIYLVASNDYGCTDTASNDIVVTSDIVFPNVFTPNVKGPNGGAYDVNDYSNDVFFPYASGITEYNLKIFNRWGELIFESNDLKVGWDGYFKDKLCQQDAYVWKADVKFFDGRTYNRTGSVTLLR